MTDLERIESAFGELEERGFFAATDHACCGSCGVSELPEDTGQYVFFHLQDSGSFFDDPWSVRDHWLETSESDGVLRRKLYLNYGDHPHDPKAFIDDDLKAGRIVVEALKRAGLEVEWNGEIDSRIAVLPNAERADLAAEEA